MHFPFVNRYSYSKKFPYLGSYRLLQVGALPHVLIEKKIVNYKRKLIFSNSQYTAEEIKKYSGKKTQILYPPYTPIITKLSKKGKLRENLVITTSRFEPNKRLEIIPYIAAQTSSNIKFAVIGRLYSKETLNKLKRIVKQLNLTDRVKFYPNLPFQEKIDLIKRAKIYLHTMIGEHFGISIVEAMALGCIPIVHNSGGMREFVPSQYRYETIQEASRITKYEIQNWTLEKEEESRKIAEHFSYDNFSKKFMDLFSKYQYY
jgi:glycosyltransferase involved in cell wall biosynthesis